MKTQRLKQIKWNRHTFSSKTAYNAKKSYVYFKNKNTSYIHILSLIRKTWQQQMYSDNLQQRRNKNWMIFID